MIVIKDKYPAAKNHILVVPKIHIENAKRLTHNHIELSNIQI